MIFYSAELVTAQLPIAKGATGAWVFDEFKAAQAAGEYPFSQVPILKTNGAVLAQSKAIERYLARKFSLAGAGEVEAAHVDAVGELLVDVRTKIQGAAGKDSATQDAAVADISRALRDLDKFASTVGTAGHLVGAGLTLADLQLYACKNYTIAGSEIKDGVLAVLAKYPKLEAIIAAVGDNKSVRAWEDARASRGEAF